jgi:hypothetical protein
MMPRVPAARFGTENDALPPLKGRLVVNALLPSKAESCCLMLRLAPRIAHSHDERQVEGGEPNSEILVCN